MKYREIVVDFLLGVLTPILIAYIALAEIFKSPGFILYWDSAFPYDPAFAFSNILHPWHWFTSAPYNPVSGVFFNLLFMPYVWLGLPAELAQKLWLLQNYALSGFSMYFAARLIIPKNHNNLAHFGGCLTALLVYMINAPALTSIHAPPRMICYAALPLAIAIYIKLMTDKRRVILSSIALVFVLTLVQVWSPLLLITLFVMASYQIWRFVGSSGKQRSTLIRDFKLDLVVVALFLALNAHLFSDPINFQLFLGRFIRPDNPFRPIILAPLSTDPGYKYILGLGNFFSLINVMTLNIKWVDLPINSMSYLVMFITPLLAFSTALLYSKWKNNLRDIVVFHILLAIFCIMFGAKSFPFGELTVFVASITKASGPLLSFLKEPAGFVFILAYSYALLIGILITLILTNAMQVDFLYRFLRTCIAESTLPVRSRKIASLFIKIATVTVVILIVVGASTAGIVNSSYPASGNLNYRLKPVKVPQEYVDANTWLQQEAGSYRVWWLPSATEVLFRFNWAPEPFTADWIQLISTKPVLWSSDFAEYIYRQEILEGKTQHLGEILSIAGVKYIVVHYDLARSQELLYPLPGQENLEMQKLALTMQKQEDLEQVYSEGFIRIFENKKYRSPIIATQSVTMVVGGLSTLTTLAESGFDLQSSTIIFTDQLNNSYVRRLLPFCDLIVLGNGKGFEDLYLPFAEDKFIYPQQFLTQTKLWAPAGDVAKGFDSEEDFPYTPYSVYSSSNGATLNITTSIQQQDLYEVWARVLRYPTGGNISTYIDGNYIGVTNTNSSRAFFKWEKINSLVLSRGDHIITIKNDYGTNVVDLVLVAGSSELNTIRSKLLDIVEGKNVITLRRESIGIFTKIDCQGTSSNINRFPVYANNYIAQSFIPQNAKISGVTLYIDRLGKPGNLTIELHPSDDNGAMLPTVLTKTIVTSSQLQVGGTIQNYDFNPEFSQLTPNRKYWILIKQMNNTGDRENSYGVWFILDDAYDGGNMMWTENGTYWVNKPKQDLFFLTYYKEEEITYNLEEAVYSNVYLYSYNVYNKTIQRIEQIPPVSRVVNIADYSMPFPGKYVVTVDASSPFILTIPEAYNPLWQVKEIDDVIHLPSYSISNGYFINKTGRLEITIEYALNLPFQVVILVSVLSLTGITLLVFIRSNVFTRLREPLVRKEKQE